MRVYVPLTLPALRQAHGAGELGPGPLEAYAVTPGLREWYVSDASDEDEELEYAALGRAARASLRLLADDAEAARRRVVVVAEVPDHEVTDGADGTDSLLAGDTVGRVRVAEAVPLAKAAAVHVDAEDAEQDVAAAAEALEAAGRGDEDARFTVDGVEDHELLWFATQEIPELVG
ncbi:hypothetical protein GCM10009801_57520 [Streptomyces albiaxialis]|uniref:Uncharacterized protein n=1 Tax=Streptomyces albiaxialis TaxID=329523 RepID=A0ABN2WFY6_9ACTN